MNLKVELLKEHSYENSEKIAWFIMDNQNYLGELFRLFWKNDKLITQRATWVIIIISEWKPKIIKPYVEEMIMALKKEGINDSIKRNTVRILAEFPIPKHMEGIITETCFNYLDNTTVPVAIKVFSMTILERIVQKYPELKEELVASIEKGMYYQTPAFTSRGRKILKRLK